MGRVPTLSVDPTCPEITGSWRAGCGVASSRFSPPHHFHAQNTDRIWCLRMPNDPCGWRKHAAAMHVVGYREEGLPVVWHMCMVSRYTVQVYFELLKRLVEFKRWMTNYPLASMTPMSLAHSDAMRRALNTNPDRAQSLSSRCEALVLL